MRAGMAVMVGSRAALGASPNEDADLSIIFDSLNQNRIKAAVAVDSHLSVEFIHQFILINIGHEPRILIWTVVGGRIMSAVAESRLKIRRLAPLDGDKRIICRISHVLLGNSESLSRCQFWNRYLR